MNKPKNGKPLSAVVAVTLLSFFATVPCSHAQPPANNNFPTTLATNLQVALDQWANDLGHRGVSAAVVLENGNEWFGTAVSRWLDTIEHVAPTSHFGSC